VSDWEQAARDWADKHCWGCGRPIATDADWDRDDKGGGGGEHLCWDFGDCQIGDGAPRAAFLAGVRAALERKVESLAILSSANGRLRAERKRLRDALEAIRDYEPEAVRAAGITPTDVRSIARAALLEDNDAE